MATELGRIERPEAEGFRAGRKLYLVPLVFAPRNPPPDYASLLEEYWRGVDEHLERLETRIGAIKHVYHESVSAAGEEALKAVEAISAYSSNICRNRVAMGATMEAIEDAELFGEMLDWQRCLMVGLVSQKVSTTVWQSYRDAQKRRNERILSVIDSTLGEGEAGVLFIAEDHSLQFPVSLQVFYVAPPALDRIHRWVRDRARAEGEAESRDTPGQQ